MSTFPRIWPVIGLLALTIPAACGEIRIADLKGDPLNPETHRAKIVAVDAIVFEDGRLSDDDARQLETLFVALSEIAAADPANTIAIAHGRELKAIAAGVVRVSAGKPLINSPMRQQWLRIRSSLFDDAAWFRRSSADPIEPAIAAAPPASPLRPATVEERTAIDQIVRSLEQIVELAKRDLPNGYETDAHREFVTIIERDLAIASERMPPPPPQWGIDIFYKDAYVHTAEALRVAKTLPGLRVGAPRSSREYLIGKIDEHVRRARAFMAEMR